MSEPTQRQIAMAVAALKAGWWAKRVDDGISVVLGSDNCHDDARWYPIEDFPDDAEDGTMIVLALAAAAEALGLEPAPSILPPQTAD